MTTKDKIMEYLRLKGISKTKFYHDTGFSNGFLDSGKSLSVDNLKIIISNFPDINLKWLLSDDDNYGSVISSLDNICNECIEKQKQIDKLQETIQNLVQESIKDHTLIRELIHNIDHINKQARSA